ncbi:hypothetical protein TWF506_007226 [Arthrobotrys conoides]|uniref:Uncharacterized protein n=1 Tax=Arthrobotrys conoides TaxID=74498 RepID=A0AAN8NNT4_9PEZI
MVPPTIISTVLIGVLGISQIAASSPLIPSPEASSTSTSCPPDSRVKCLLEKTRTQDAEIGATYPATSSTDYSKSPALETLNSVSKAKKDIATTSKKPPQPEATVTSFQITPNTRSPASQSSHLNGEEISGKRAILGDFLLVTTIIVCKSSGDIIEMSVEDYELRDNWLHHDNPVIDELDYRHWSLEIDMLQEVWVPGRAEPRRQLLNAISESVAGCKSCNCERGEDGEPTGKLVGTGDDGCPQSQADDCNVTYVCGCVDWATTSGQGSKSRRLKGPGLKAQNPQRWRYAGTKEPYYLEGPESRYSGRPYWSYMGGIGAALAAVSTADRSRRAHGYERSGWRDTPKIRKRGDEEFPAGFTLPENKGDPKEDNQGKGG